MDLLSISDLQRYSGIKAHTIRVWEQRYGAFKPERTTGNTRYYNSKQLRRLLNVATLLKLGHKVSKICVMTDAQLTNVLKKQQLTAVDPDAAIEYYVNQLIGAAMDYDETKFTSVLDTSVQQYGLKNAYVNIIYPTLLRVGLMYCTDDITPSKEHFITHLFKQKICSATDSLPKVSTSNDAWLLFLPEDEFHELGLLFANYLLREAGQKVIYLGPNVPLESCKSAVEETGANQIMFFLIHQNNPDDDKKYIINICNMFSSQRVYLSCDPARNLHFKLPENLRVLHSVPDFESAIS